MAKRIVVTFAAKDGGHLPWLVDGDDEADGTPVPLPDGLAGVIRNPPTVIRESAGGPEFWTQVVQVIIEHGDKVATTVIGSAIGAWVTRKIAQRDSSKTSAPATPTVIDQSVHNNLRVFIGKIEVELNEDQIAAVVRDAFDAPDQPIKLPPAIRDEMAAKAGMTPEEYDDWVEDDG